MRRDVIPVGPCIDIYLSKYTTIAVELPAALPGIRACMYLCIPCVVSWEVIPAFHAAIVR